MTTCHQSPGNLKLIFFRLSTLDISNNTIVDIGEAFVDMPELKFLDLSYNHLPSIKTGAFRRMPKLLALHLDHNSIISVAPDAFQVKNDLFLDC